METIKLPKPNFTMRMGEVGNALSFDFQVKRTWLNRLKYWLFCKFFPFKIVRWNKFNE